MAAFKQKNLVWLTVFMLYLGSVCADATSKPPVIKNTTTTHQSSIATTRSTSQNTLGNHNSTGANTTVSHITATENTTRTSPSTQATSLKDTETNTSAKPTTTSSSAGTSTDTTTTTTPPTTPTPETTTTTTPTTPTTTPPTTSTQETTTTTTPTTTTTATTTTTTTTTAATSTSTSPTTTPTTPSTESSTESPGGATPEPSTAKPQDEQSTSGATDTLSTAKEDTTLSTSVTTQEETTSTASNPTTTTPVTTTTETDYCAGVTCENNGTCSNSHNNFTCECKPGWQGRLCHEEKYYCQPSPCQNGGNCTQNLTLSPDYYLCDCSNGFTGSTCTQDVHECDNATICGNGVCIELTGSYSCVCQNGWTGEHCETDTNECSSTKPVCPGNQHCNNTEGGFHCICDDPLEYIDHLCQRTVLWADFKSGTEFTKQTVYDIKTSIPFPYFESASRDLFVYKYGYVAFGANILSSQAPYVPSQWPYSTKLFGVYWADIAATDNSKNPSQFYVSLDEGPLGNLTYNSTLIQYVKDAVNWRYFFPLSVVAVTWVNAVPNPAKNFQTDNATFQVIFATDGRVTYAITAYRTVWENTNVYNRPFVQIAHSLENGVRSNETTPGNAAGPLLEKLVADEGGLNFRSLECVQKTQDARIRFSEDLRSLPPCPCYQAEAANDERFQVSSSTSCYSTRPSSESSLSPLCCFDGHGFLVNYTLPNSVDRDLQEARDQCCTDGYGLCDWFHTQISTRGCGEYVPPFVGGGFGDPHFLTFDGNKYSYNGLGDFVIFKSGDTVFQGRTNISSNKNTTVFVAYALKAGNNTYKFYPENNSVRLDNGATNSTETEQKVVTSNIVVKVRSKNATLSYEINLLSTNYADSQGLLGHVDHNASNDFRFQDGTLKEGKAGQLTANIINLFGESWRANNSLFDGYIEPANFTPAVLETTPEAVLKQIRDRRNQTGFDEATQICGSELFCLQDYLIEGDPESAQDTLDEATDISNHQNISNLLPKFENTQDYLQVNISHLLNLTLVATSSTQANFSLSSNFSSLAGFRLEGKQLTWNISADLEDLRSVSYPQNLVFYVTNEYNLSAEYSPIISLCLCEKTSQCSIDPPIYADNNSTDKYFRSNDGTRKGNVGSQICDCDGRAEGEFCEKAINACQNCFVKNETLCNIDKEDYCPPCPKGYEGNKFLCPDVDECATDNGGCQQTCNNTDGSFFCGCFSGYILNRDKKTCHDDNECLEKNACKGPTEYCINFPGGHHCVCYPGLVGQEKCILAPYTFYGSLGLRALNDQKMSYFLLVKTSKEFIALADKVTNAITGALVNNSLLREEELYVEVLSFENDTAPIATTRAKRDTSSHVEAYTLVHYLIHTSNITVSNSDINKALSDALNGCNTSCQLGGLLFFPGKFPAVDDGKDLCTHQDVHHCDPLTTECEYDYDSHVTQCNCKRGYTSFEMNLFSCYDINECSNTTLCGPRKELCHNLPGSYECDCGKGKVWDSSTKSCVGDKCSKTPCENDGTCFISNNDQGFVCSCTYGWNGPVCGDEDTDARRMKVAVICIAAILGFCCLALFIIVVVVCVKQRRISKETSESGNYSEIKSSSHSKVTQRESNEMEENGRGNAYSQTSFDRSSDKRTSFDTPVPETKNSKVYYNQAFENDVVARL